MLRRDSRHRWFRVIAVGATALLTVIATDAAFSALVQFGPPLREVADAVADYDRSDPTVLVLGSSHARTFEVTGRLLEQRTRARERMLAVPLEFGKLSSYLWVVEHRLRPRIDATDASGRRERPSLRHLLLVTEWWDTCPVGPPGSDRPAANLPARAWVFSDFLADAIQDGLTDYNKNYLSNLVTQALIRSSLIRDRGHETIKERLRNLVSEVSPAVARAAFERRVHDWHEMLESGAGCLGDPREAAALDAIVEFFRARGVEVTVILYPKMPVTVTPRGRDITLLPFSRWMARWAQARGVRLLDWTLDHPLKDEDWEVDFDHLTPEGNWKLSEWALDRDLRFLVAPERNETTESSGHGEPP